MSVLITREWPLFLINYVLGLLPLAQEIHRLYAYMHSSIDTFMQFKEQRRRYNGVWFQT